MPVGDPSVNRHKTRTLLFNDAGDLFVSVGSEAIDDTDPDAYRSRILSYPQSGLGGDPIVWTAGASFAVGTRNAVAIGLRNGVLYSVDNGQGEIIDDRFGGNLTPDQVGFACLHLKRDDWDSLLPQRRRSTIRLWMITTLTQRCFFSFMFLSADSCSLYTFSRRKESTDMIRPYSSLAVRMVILAFIRRKAMSAFILLPP